MGLTRARGTPSLAGVEADGFDTHVHRCTGKSALRGAAPLQEQPLGPDRPPAHLQNLCSDGVSDSLRSHAVLAQGLDAAAPRLELERSAGIQLGHHLLLDRERAVHVVAVLSSKRILHIREAARAAFAYCAVRAKRVAAVATVHVEWEAQLAVTRQDDVLLLG